MSVRCDDLLGSVAATAQAVFEAAACSIALLDATGSTLGFRAAVGAGADAVVGMRIPSSKGIAGYVVMSGQTMAVADVAADTRFARDTAEETGYVPSAILAAPLIYDGEALGVIEVLDPAGDRSLELLGRFADQAALVAAAFDGDGSGAAAGRSGAEQALLDAAVEYARHQSP